MLFLLNDQIVDIEAPEIHLSKSWKALGCGDPMGMRAREALEFASRMVAVHVQEAMPLSAELVRDLGSLIIAKTGANAALFPVYGKVMGEPRLTILPESILASLKERHAANGTAPDLAQIWPIAA
jgi:hypothetical protein